MVSRLTCLFGGVRFESGKASDHRTQSSAMIACKNLADTFSTMIPPYPRDSFLEIIELWIIWIVVLSNSAL